MQRSFRLKNIRSDEAFIIEKPSVLIGRSPQCDIYIDSAMLSRHHASVLLVDDDTVLIKDLESTNGTFVNSMRISRANRLTHGDVVTIGDAKFIFIDPTLDESDDEHEDLLASAKIIEIGADATSNRTMIQSSIFKSLGLDLDPNAYNLFGKGDDDSVRSGFYDPLALGDLDASKIPAALIVKTGRKKGGLIKLKLPAFSEKQWSVGRSQLCDVVLEDPTVSSQHALIRWQDGVWEIEDNGSTNGIKINGHAVQQTPFQHDDVLSIGSIKLLFKVLMA